MAVGISITLLGIWFAFGMSNSLYVVAVGISITLLGIWFAFGMSNSLYVVASGSMIPNLNINDFVVVSHNEKRTQPFRL